MLVISLCTIIYFRDNYRSPQQKQAHYGNTIYGMMNNKKVKEL